MIAVVALVGFAAAACSSGEAERPASEDQRTVVPSSNSPAALPYSVLDGEVTFSAAPPWRESCCLGPWSLSLGDAAERIYVLADPLPVRTGCRKGPAPADAEALARSIDSDPDLEATAPVAARVGGTQALRMDVAAAPAASECDRWAAPLVVTQTGVEQAFAQIAAVQARRIRLYLLGLPEGSSAGILAIAIVAPDARFEAVVEAAAPILDSFEFGTG
ncbi:MAG TPA: hypothetical protein VKA30_03225 [Actinomycetota bacterium]|nr:hypothetical protein [Actinomycetota bacterium]